MSSRDLQNCAQLLGHFLDADKTKSAQTHSYLKSLRKEKPVVAKGKGKSKRGRSQVKKQTATSSQPPNVDQIDEDIQRMIRIKRAREGHPVLNDKQEKDLHSKDTDQSDITAPYNQRLLSSTPQDTPVKIAGKASVSNLLQGDIGEHALNSFEYIRNINPPKESPRPKLKEGQVDYIAHPQKVSVGRGAFTQEHLDGMRQAYMSCLTESQIRQHHAGNQKPTNLPSTLPQPIVLSGPNPTVLYPASHMVSSANANVAAQIGGYHLSQNPQQSGVYHVTTSTGSTNAVGNDELTYNPNYYIISGNAGVRSNDPQPLMSMEGVPPSDNTRYNSDEAHVLREPAEKETTQYSLYSNTTSLPQQENLTHSTEKDSQSRHRTISPFKADEQREPSQPVSRKDLIKSALKIALDDNGYLKSGPISPFKAGPKGFSSCNHNNLSEGSFGTNREGIEGCEELQGEDEEKEADVTLVDSAPTSSRESSPKPAKTQGKPVKTVAQNKELKTTQQADKLKPGVNKSSKMVTTGSDNKKVIMATKTKKVQFVPSKKKTKEGKSIKKVVTATNNNKSIAAETNKAKNAKITKSKGQEVMGDDGKSSLSKQEENKENLQPEEMVTTETGVVGETGMVTVDIGKYSSTMRRMQHLVKEVKAVPGIKLDKEGKRLLKELGDTVQTGTSNLQTDLDLALQPIRSENAQLRRKVRILTQQLKDKQREVENAQKPDPNFMVVHLQMKLYNVENDAKSLRATNNKLKEDIRLYLSQLEKLSADRAELVCLFGNKTPGQTVVGRNTERGSLQSVELDAYKRQKVTWDREREELTHDRQGLQLSLKHKEAELASMQELVRSLQGSMTRLLEDLQTSKPCPDQSVSRLNRELEHVQAIIDTRGQTRPPTQLSSDSSASIPHTFPPADSQMTSQNRQGRSNSVDRPNHQERGRIQAPETGSRMRVPERRAVSQQREPARQGGRLQERKPAHRSATDLGCTGLEDDNRKGHLASYSREEMDRLYRQEQDKWGKDVMPRTYAQSKASSRERSLERESDGGSQEKFMGKSAVSTTNSKSPRIPKTHPTEKVGLYLMDQPGLNINKMAQSLSTSGGPTPLPQRVSMSTNPETDVTDYNIFPGMSPMKGSAFSKLDPFIRDVIVNKQPNVDVSPSQRQGGFAYKSGQNSKGYLTSQSAPVFEQEEFLVVREGDGKAETAYRHGDVHAPVPMSSRTSESRDTVSSAPTVKELLTPLADRMERFRSMTEVKKSGAMRAINFDVEEDGQGTSKLERRENVVAVGTPRGDDLDDTYNMDLEGELEKLQYEVSSEDTSTFSEEAQTTAPEDKATQPKEPENPNQSESRYSVTDYFNKYPQKNTSGHPFIPQETLQENIDDGKLISCNKTRQSAWQNVKSEDALDVRQRVEGLHLPSDEDEEGQWVDKVIFSPNGIPMIFDDTNDEIESIEVNIDDEQIATEFRNLRDLSEKEVKKGSEEENSESPQKEIYKGTDLDTSLSSINEGDSVGTATTTTSISSVDDRVFRQGLANLDANIARVQQSLRQKLY